MICIQSRSANHTAITFGCFFFFFWRSDRPGISLLFRMNSFSLSVWLYWINAKAFNCFSYVFSSHLGSVTAYIILFILPLTKWSLHMIESKLSSPLALGTYLSLCLFLPIPPSSSSHSLSHLPTTGLTMLGGLLKAFFCYRLLLLLWHFHLFLSANTIPSIELSFLRTDSSQQWLNLGRKWGCESTVITFIVR